jgi:hypothetical protein
MGELRIVAERDLGGLGSTSGAAVTVHWPFWRLPLRLLPWALLVGVVFAPFNRGGQAGWILVAWGISLGLVGIGSVILNAFAGGGEELRDVLSATSYGIALALLCAPLFRGRSKALVLTAMVAVLGLAAQFGRSIVGWSFEEGMVRVVLVIGMGIVSVAAGVGAWCSRRSRGVGRFSLWFLVWLLVLVGGVISVFGILAGGDLDDLTRVLTTGAALAVVLWITALPYAVLGVLNARHAIRWRELLWNPDPSDLHVPR